MAINCDVESGEKQRSDELAQPLMKQVTNPACEEEDGPIKNRRGSLLMVWISTFVAVCGSFEFGACVGYSAPTQSAITNDLGLSLAEYSAFGSIVTIGAMVGGITSGRIADLIGRKGAMRMSAVCCITGWVAIIFSLGTPPLYIGRFCSGYGVGVFSYTVPVFIAEITPKNLRGGLTTLNQLLVVTGVSTMYIAGEVLQWRVLTAVGIIPCVVVLLGLFFTPESPRWLAKVGRQEEFEAALQRLRGKDADVSEEAAEIQDYIETLQKLPKARITDLFRSSYIRPVIVGVGLMVFQQFGGINGIIYFGTEAFVSAGFSSEKIGTIAMGVIQVPITLLGAFLMDKTGRRPLLMMSATGTCLFNLVAGMSYYFKSHGLLLEWVPTLALTGILGFLASFSLGMGAVPWVMMSEIFPINVKGIGGSLVTLVKWFGSGFISYTFSFLMSWSSSGTFFIYAGFCVAAVLFVEKIVPETKGRTLEEIQMSMNSW